MENNTKVGREIEYIKEVQICPSCGGRGVTGNFKWGYSKPCKECETEGRIEVLVPKTKK